MSLTPPHPHPRKARADVSSSYPDLARLRNGDLLLTYGTAGWWPPRRWLLGIVYHAIRKFQQRRWGSDADTGATHVRVWLYGRFFEATIPVCKWTSVDTLALTIPSLRGGALSATTKQSLFFRKHWIIVRSRTALDGAAMLQVAYRLVHTPYDKGDLLDFALSGWLGRAASVISLFGDRANKYRVCSPAAAEILQAGGAPFRLPITQVDPAYFANMPDDWQTVAISNDH